MWIFKIIKIKCFYPPRILDEHWCIILVYKFRPERTGFNMYAEYTQPQLTFLALVPWFTVNNLWYVLYTPLWIVLYELYSRMFYELDLVSRFGLDHNVLCRWLLTTKKNYRVEVLYHNWNHAFNVAQVLNTGLQLQGTLYVKTKTK